VIVDSIFIWLMWKRKITLEVVNVSIVTSTLKVLR